MKTQRTSVRYMLYRSQRSYHQIFAYMPSAQIREDLDAVLRHESGRYRTNAPLGAGQPVNLEAQ